MVPRRMALEAHDCAATIGSRILDPGLAEEENLTIAKRGKRQAKLNIPGDLPSDVYALPDHNSLVLGKPRLLVVSDIRYSRSVIPARPLLCRWCIDYLG